jgi:hypothetical protein
LADELSTANSVFTVGYIGVAGFVSSLSEPVSFLYEARLHNIPPAFWIRIDFALKFATIICLLADPDDVTNFSTDDKKDLNPDADTFLSIFKAWCIIPSLALVLVAGCCNLKTIAEFMFISMVSPFVLKP